MKVEENKTTSKKYFYELNFIRAIACLLVVMVHVTARNYHVNDQTFNWATMFLNQVSRFGTPLFAIISGFLLYNQAINRGFQVRKFISSRFTKIVIPFVVWSLAYLYLKSYKFPWIEGGHTTEGFLSYFLVGDSFYHLYFMVVVVQFYLLFPLLQLAKTKKSMITLTLITFFINYFYLSQPFDTGNEQINLYTHDRGFIFHWIFFFMLGGLLVHYWKTLVEWIEGNAKFSMMLGAIVVIFGVYEYSFLGFYTSSRVSNLINLPLIFAALTGLYFIMGRWSKIRDYIVELGNLSMGVYFVHPFVLYIIQNHATFLLDKTRWLLLTYVITVVASIIIVKIITEIPFGQYIVSAVVPKKSKVPDKNENQRKREVAS